eukprot:TRINITY_DN34008_c0_g1_i1.p1 TRINITY_DN34008_c0_g1~~TRINITY_DN34008_c0_g1_i1.p1  ORF type:complete len:421 (-),score=74.74 TRINITY_DN34008_c0_g1_i1:86-1348(-)
MTRGSRTVKFSPPRDALPRVLSWLELRAVFRSGEVCQAWHQASFSLEVWSRLHLNAQRQARALYDTEPATEPYPSAESNIHVLGEKGMLRVAVRLRDVALHHEAATGEVLEVLPQRPPWKVKKSSDEKDASEPSPWMPSQVEVFKYYFGDVMQWFLQYNTECFGWFAHTTDVALGLKIWAPCLVMCHYFCSPDAPVLRSRRCLEVGAGAGILGVELARLGAESVVTDIDDLCLQASRVNAALNGVEANCQVLRLEYGEQDAKRFARRHGQFDYIFGADVLYVDRVAALLFETAEHLLAPWGCFYLGVVERHKHITQELRRAASENGWSWELPRPIGKELGHLCPAFRGHKPQSPHASQAPLEAPRSGMAGALFDLQKELQATKQRCQAHSHSTSTGGEPPERVELYRFVRRGAFRLDNLD